MSYYSKVEGTIVVSSLGEDLIRELNAVCEDDGETLLFPPSEEVYVSDNEDGRIRLDIEGNINYDEDVVTKWLDVLTPVAVYGKIEYVGEDGSLWRHRYTEGKWFEDAGRVTYEESERHFLPITYHVIPEEEEMNEDEEEETEDEEEFN